MASGNGKYTLKSNQTFRRQRNDGSWQQCTLPKGKSVDWHWEEVGPNLVNTFTYTDSDNYVWTAVVTIPNVNAPAAPAAVAAPVKSATNGALAATAQTAAHAVAATVRSAPVRDDEKDDVYVNEQRIRRLAKVAEVLSGKVYQINYYIPTRMADKVGMAHCRIFRRHGFRLDGSNWVMPAKGLESKAVQKVLRDWDAFSTAEEDGEGGLSGFTFKVRVRYWVIEYTQDQLAKMRDLALSQLADELRKTHCSLIKRIDTAAESLKKAQEELAAKGIKATARDRDAVENKYHGALRATVREACERFEMCLRGAEIFDDTGSLDSLFGAVRDSVRTQALAVNAYLRAKRVTTVQVPESIVPKNASIGSGPAPR